MKTEEFNPRNYLYGVGTLGRDMVYALTSMYLMYYVTDILQISASGIAVVTGVMVVLRIFDAINDPFMGMLIDNTQSRWGKFKPWIFMGSLLSALTTIMLFYDYDVTESTYLIIFSIVYLLWGITYTAHDISYWSMLPALSRDQAKREKIGSIAKICADIGIFSVVVGIVPITQWLSDQVGDMRQAYFVLAIALSLAMLVFIWIMLVCVKETKLTKQAERTSPKEIIRIIVDNDQLLWVVIALVLFTIANTTTTSLGLYYFEYIYGQADAYSSFAMVLGLSQLTALVAFPWLSQAMGRRKLYALGTFFVCIGYTIFFIAHDMLWISIGGVFIFFGEGFIQILMLMFISDCVDYGEWKLGRRNDSITLSLQPFIAKMGSAISAGIVGMTVLVAGIKEANGPQNLSPENVTVFKFFMLILPLITIVISFVIYRWKYRIDEATYQQIRQELDKRQS